MKCLTWVTYFSHNFQNFTFKLVLVTLENIPQDNTAEETGPAWKKELYKSLKHPMSSKSAFIIHILMTGLFESDNPTLFTLLAPSLYSHITHV